MDLKQIPKLDNAVSSAIEWYEKIEAWIKPFMGDGKEPSAAPGLKQSTLAKSITQAVDRQPITTETMKYIQGATAVTALLVPLALLLQSTWQFLEGLKPLQDAAGQLDKAIGGSTGKILDAVTKSPGIPVARFGQLSRPLQEEFLANRSGQTDAWKLDFARRAGLTATELEEMLGLTTDADTLYEQARGLVAKGIGPSDFSEEGLADPDKFKELSNLTTVPPTPGISDEPLSMGEALDRAMTQLPVVAVPRKNPQPGDEAPPICDLVNTNQFRHKGNLLAVLGNPAAALQDDRRLAQDLAQLAGQQLQLAEAADSTASAFTDLGTGQYARSFYHSLRAILRMLVLYNYQNGPDGKLASATLHSLRYWQQLEAPPALLPQALLDKLNTTPGTLFSSADQATWATLLAKLNDGETLTEEETTNWETLRDLLVDAATLTEEEQDQLTGAASTLTETFTTEGAIGALPGTLLYAALKDDPYTGSLDSLLDAIPLLIARQLDLPEATCIEVNRIATNLRTADDRVLELPDLLAGANPRYGQIRTAVRRWVETLQYLQALSDEAVARLDRLEYYIGSIGYRFLLFIREQDLTTLYQDLVSNRLTYTEYQSWLELTRLWDEIAAKITPPTDQDEARLFLTEVLATKSLLPAGTTLTAALAELEQLSFRIGGPLGEDLGRMTGVAAVLIRATKLLWEDGDETDLKRLGKLLTHGETLSTEVQHFPNPGMMQRLAAAVEA